MAEQDEAETPAGEPERRPGRLGVRQFLSEVNLKDFGAMVGTELGLVASSVRQAFADTTFALPLVLLMALVRLLLLVVVLVVFGTGILLITAVRFALRLGRSQPGPG